MTTAKATAKVNGRKPVADLDSTAVEVASAVDGSGVERDRLTLGSGIVLRLKTVPPHVFDFAIEKHPLPPVPTWHDPNKDREEPNPNDPDYIAACLRVEQEQLAVVGSACLILGVEVESVPPGVQRPEDTEWLDDLDLLGVEVDRENPRARKLAWLRYYAFRTPVEIAIMTRYCMGRAGTPEEVVQQVIASFRSQS